MEESGVLALGSSGSWLLFDYRFLRDSSPKSKTVEMDWRLPTGQNVKHGCYNQNDEATNPHKAECVSKALEGASLIHTVPQSAKSRIEHVVACHSAAAWDS